MGRQGFAEHRQSYRLPFRSKFIFMTKDRVLTGNAMNMSSRGAFVMTLEMMPRDSEGLCIFPVGIGQPPFIAVGKVKRVVPPSGNPDEMPGVGFQFVSSPEGFTRLEDFIDKSVRSYELVATVLSTGEPDLASLKPLLAKLHLPPSIDLAELRFQVERVLKSIELVDENNRSLKT